jgi:hypothetical protein
MKRYFIDDFDRLCFRSPAWETDINKVEIGKADSVWRTALACFAYPEKRKKFIDSIMLAKENGKYKRHPNWEKDDFSRDQWVMAACALYIFDKEKFLEWKPKLKLSKRFFITIDMYAWYMFLKTKSKFWFFIYEKFTLFQLATYFKRWNLSISKYDKRVLPEYYGFHLLCWMYYCIRKSKPEVKNSKLHRKINEFLDLTNGKVEDRNILLNSLINGNMYDIYDESKIIRSSGFMWQNLVPWHNLLLNSSQHKYTNQYFIELEEDDLCFTKDILNYDFN